MKFYSIYTQITISFVIIFLIVCFSFITSTSLDIRSYNREINFNQGRFIKNLINHYDVNSSENLYTYLKQNGFASITNSEFEKKLKENTEEVVKIKSRSGNFVSFVSDEKLYVHYEDKNGSFSMQSNREDTTTTFIFFGFLFCVGLMIFFYFSIIKSLFPLKKLKKEISRISDIQNFSPDGYANNEIGEIAREFSNTMQHNRALIESRQFFLRAIMHELKTPIGKGRIIVEMMQDLKNKKRLIIVFERLNLLINEFAKIENILSKSYNLNIQLLSFTDILAKAKSFLMRDDFKSKVKTEIKEVGIYEADIETAALLLKNLIDNALKYSKDGICYVYSYKNYFMIKNRGDKFKQDFHEYLRAFYRDKNDFVEGMGLGLYIVDQICNIHNFVLSYEYKDGFHHFFVSKSYEDVVDAKRA